MPHFRMRDGIVPCHGSRGCNESQAFATIQLARPSHFRQAPTLVVVAYPAPGRLELLNGLRPWDHTVVRNKNISQRAKQQTKEEKDSGRATRGGGLIPEGRRLPSGPNQATT